MAVSENHLEKLFLAALELTTAERPAFLETECYGNESLKKKLSALLVADEKAENDDFWEKSAVEIEARNLTETFQDIRIGQTIGHYKIIEKINAGGMGTIYLASRSDGQFEKNVALKLIKRGMDSEAILKRFLLERQILANLEHLNIARLLDAGMTGDGLPFFVMEYIEGVPITDFCQNQELSINERLELFLAVCSAVSYAHQNLIVHRDLKPSNILVTAEGKPKLLDFGIAKLLNSNEAESVTKTDFRILTPAYASPEQVRGEQITTASDTYALGIILYELMTQNPPYQVLDKNIGEVIRVICETEPDKPSSKFKVQNSKEINSKFQIPNSKSLHGDLDNIVLKALQKQPLRRYSSVEKFAEDIRLHLKGLPITARPDSFIYRADKFIKRNWLTVGALITIFLVLSAGIAATLWQARQAKIAGEKAQKRADNLRKLSNSFAVELHNEILNLPGSLHARQLLVTRAVEQLDALAAEADDDLALQDELAEAYYQLGLLPSGNIAQIGQNFQKGVDLYTNLLKSQPHNVRFNQQLAVGYENLANHKKMIGQSAESLENLQKAAVILEKIATEDPSDVETRRLLFDVETDTASWFSSMGKAQESLETSRKVLALGEDLQQIDKTADDFDKAAYVSRYEIAKMMIFLGDYENAAKSLQNDINVWTEIQSRHPSDTRYDHRLWACYLTFSKAEERKGDIKSASVALEKSLAIMENLHRKSPDDTGYQRNTSFTYLSAGQFWLRQNSSEKALPNFQKSLQLSEKIYVADAEKVETIADLARIYAGLGNSQILLGNHSEGLQNLKKSLVFYEKSLATDAANAPLKRDFAETLGWLGNVEKSPETKEFYARSLEIWRDLQSKDLLSAVDARQPDEAAQKLLKLK